MFPQPVKKSFPTPFDFLEDAVNEIVKADSGQSLYGHDIIYQNQFSLLSSTKRQYRLHQHFLMEIAHHISLYQPQSNVLTEILRSQ
jgi:hypothetical protein